MPSHARPKRPFLFALTAAAIAAIAATNACTSPDSKTPDCVYNVDSNGVHPVPNGCVKFATCDKGAPAECCKDDKGMPLTGSDLAFCLYSYGGCASLSIDNMGNSICNDSYDGGSSNGSGGGGGGGTGGSGGGSDGGSDGG